MILPSTADRTAGLCMPCKQGTRESMEQSKEFYRKQKEYDPHRELWTYLVKKAHATDDAFKSLSKEEKIYYAVGVLEGEVYNGGMHQFFSNSSGALYLEAIEGLTHLGATKALWLLRRAAKILFGSIRPPKNRLQRWETMKHYPENDSTPLPEWCIELEEIDKAYWEDPDKINELLNKFSETTGLIQPFYKPNN